ncbi:DUF4350 domain-containing protein [Nocardioides zeae]|uniref:DUF4350 domain-containing protein n=1 Tax=Nocardioides imazamoxiresistens TaxID=3231893 RepID=A0ABU3PYP5_9ACTN|nr:DUF4350 domain-containing protein [Nocardioides zeae]MDT9594301.1 DUF4350 domain-containing protein [Nocardioides zeae]
MTATDVTTTTDVPDRTDGRPARPRRRLVVVATLGLAVVVLLVGALLLTPAEGGQGRLDPDDATPEGGRALARVLADQGVEVVVARDAAALDAADVDEGTVVLVSGVDALGPDGARGLRRAGAARVLVDAARLGAGDLFGVDDGGVSFPDGPVAAGCSAGPGADLAGLEVEIDSGRGFRRVDGCFGTEAGDLLAVDGDVVLLGMSDALTNGQVLRADNAAVALRLLGAEDRLVWYVPDAADLQGTDDQVGLEAFLPPWLGPTVALTVVVLLATAWWRGRRFGPLAVEPMPVVVRATETTASRGRLYHRSHDRAHAAHALREATRARVASHLAHPRGTPTHVLVGEVAARTGWPAATVGALIDPQYRVPADDAGLMAFAQQLTDLEREVRRR